MVLKCMIVDDEELSRLVVKQFISKTSFLEVTHELSSGVDALKMLTSNENPDVDIIFLDVQMPGMSGIELMESLKGAYHIIFITSEERYAVKAFEGEAIDFLVKPIEYERFLKAAERAREEIERRKLLAENNKEFYIKADSRLVRLSLNEIKYIEALADYIMIVTTKDKLIVHHTMKGIESKLPGSIFSRVHRSYIINYNHIDYIEDLQIVIGDKGIPVGASFKDKLFSKLNFL
jgi:DNA-binding LytR/AlgR family response regulator